MTMADEEQKPQGIAGAIKNSAILGAILVLLVLGNNYLKFTGELRKGQEEQKTKSLEEDRRRNSIETRLDTLEDEAGQLTRDLEETIEALNEEVDTLNTFRIGEYASTIDKIRIDLASLEKITEQIAGDLKRLTSDVKDNSQFKVVQEKRATIRIEQQKNREERLILVEKYIDDERVRDSHRADDFENRVQELDLQVIRLEQELARMKLKVKEASQSPP